MNSEPDRIRDDAPSPSTEPNAAADASANAAAAPPATAPRGFSLGRVLTLAGPIAVLVIGGGAFFGYFDGAKRIERWRRPPLVPARGQVLYNGEPLIDGQVTASSRGGPGSIGYLDKNGRFILRTDIDGDYVDGAFVGEHVVTVAWTVTQPGASPPLLKTPVIYSSPATSPLRITVSPSAAKNDFTIEIEGAPPPTTTPPPPGPPATPSEPKNGAPPDADQP